MLNGYYFCTKGNAGFTKLGKVYKFVDGKYHQENGILSGVWLSLENFNYCCSSQLKEIKTNEKG